MMVDIRFFQKKADIFTPDILNRMDLQFWPRISHYKIIIRLLED